jgi:hypothetical protein
MPLIDDYVRTSGPGRESGWGESGDTISYVARSTGTGSRNGDLFGEEASVASVVPRSTAAAAYMPTPAALGRLRSLDDQAAAMVSSSARLPASLHPFLCAREHALLHVCLHGGAMRALAEAVFGTGGGGNASERAFASRDQGSLPSHSPSIFKISSSPCLVGNVQACTGMHA